MRRTSVITYTRVSTKAQGQKGVSLEDQQQEIDAFLVEHDFQSRGEFSDIDSGVNEENGSKRKNYNVLYRASFKNDWPVVTTVPSRLTRTLAEFDRFIARGCWLICVKLGINATNEELRAYLMTEIIENERRQRMSATAQKQAKLEGRAPGNPNLAPARVKSAIARKANALVGYAEFERQLEMARADGATKPKEIAAAFNKVGFKPAQAERWKAGNVMRVLETITKLKAASGVLSPAGVVSIGNDNVESSTSPIAASTTGLKSAAQSVSIATQTAYPLTSDELAEFRELLDQSLTPAEKIAEFIRWASHPALAWEQRASIMNWMAKKRAA